MRSCFCVYTDRTREAVALYLDAFRAELGFHIAGEDGAYRHAELMKDGRLLMDVTHSDRWTTGEPCMQFCLNFGAENRAALDHAYELLAKDGTVLRPLGPCDWNERMADLVDPFGARWYIAL